MSGKRKLTENLVAPKGKKEFTKEWARCIIVDYQAKTDPDWLLADCLKVLDVTVKDNPHPGKKMYLNCLESRKHIKIRAALFPVLTSPC